MMKLTTLVLLVLCGVAVNPSSTLAAGDCPDLLSSLPVVCGPDVDLSFPTHLDCSSTNSECPVGLVLETLGLDPEDTQYNSPLLIEALGVLGISPDPVSFCLDEVEELITGEVDVIECQTALTEAFILCLFQSCLV